ncbi:TonB-dependent receptor domain-containing protein [Roseibium aggregatum]|uniref:TonB-dependent receptor n=1 Tax=Roseibium aggregatum TaxID=187304 RepID=A0A939EFU1_9HYPH|nr:TonB-dependent receptor [Roseibium aggregatum]MBN9672213.1 TonB-dependent receptor [Roseibium aggregatum]
MPVHAQNLQQAVSVDLPAGPLSTALNRLARQTGLQIGYDSGLVSGITSPGLSGQYTAEEALDVLLAGTGIDYTISGSGTIVLGQQASPVVNDPLLAEGTTLLPVITVSGEKLPRDLFTTYTSVGVVTNEDISNYTIQTLDQSLNRLANVRANPTGDGNNSFAIRGLDAEGVTQPSRSQPIISVTIDGALQGVEATRRGSRGIWDVDQIEVLRGPQSTLQGRNALGGAVIIETKDPTFEPELLFEGDLATEQFMSGAFAISTPIVEDQVAIRIAGQAFRDEADIHYADPTIESLGEDAYEEIRGKVLITPEALPGFTALLSASYTHDKPSWHTVSGPDFFAREFVDATNSSAEFRDTEVGRYVADLSYELAPGWELKSVSALTDTTVDIWSTPNSSLGRQDTRDITDLSQDFRLTYDSPDSNWSGVFGIFAGRSTTDVDSLITTDFFAPFFPDVPVQDLTSKTETTSFAAYADLRYKAFDRITFMGGGRLLQDRVTTDYSGEALDVTASIIAGFPVFGSLDEDTSTTNVVFLPKVGAAFDITEDQTVSAFVSQGYRTGFSETVAGSTSINEVEPEFLWSYELAYRSRWLEDRLEIFANAFYYDYDNQQIVVDNPAFTGQTITENAGKSHAYGAEIEVRYQPVRSLEFYSAVGLLKTEFDEADTSTGDYSGNEFPEAPALTASLGGIWHHDSGFFAGADVQFTSGYYSSSDLANTAAREIDAYTIVNAQLGYEFEHGKITAYAKNLFNEQYLTSISSNLNEATIGDGMSVGVRLNANF